MAARRRADWLIPAGLIALALIPIVAGLVRLGLLAAGGPPTARDERFFSEPVPVVVHIIGSVVFSILGAGQFATGLRRQRPGWHRVAGRIAVAAGLATAASGIWMAHHYAIVPADNALLHSLRVVFGWAMLLSIAWGFVAALRGQLASHQAWMRRAYAIGLGAGTQSLIQIPPLLLLGPPSDMGRALMMGAGWLVNLAVAEWLIRAQRDGVAGRMAAAARPAARGAHQANAPATGNALRTRKNYVQQGAPRDERAPSLPSAPLK